MAMNFSYPCFPKVWDIILYSHSSRIQNHVHQFNFSLWYLSHRSKLPFMTAARRNTRVIKGNFLKQRKSLTLWGNTLKDAANFTQCLQDQSSAYGTAAKIRFCKSIFVGFRFIRKEKTTHRHCFKVQKIHHYLKFISLVSPTISFS